MTMSIDSTAIRCTSYRVILVANATKVVDRFHAFMPERLRPSDQYFERPRARVNLPQRMIDYVLSEAQLYIGESALDIGAQRDARSRLIRRSRFRPWQSAVAARLLILPPSPIPGRIYSVAFGEATTLNVFHGLIAASLTSRKLELSVAPAVYADFRFRAGDVRHSLANIDKAKQLLGYSPTHSVRAGILEAIDWYERGIG